MIYKYTGNESYADLAAGRVIYHRPGFTNFPVRLSVEIFMTCLEITGRPDNGVVLYDPCCGGAYLLTVLGFARGDMINSIYVSDNSAEAMRLANQNLNLLNARGLSARKARLEKLYEEFNKDSHREAVESADKLLQKVYARKSDINYNTFNADITETDALVNCNFKADIVFTDVPYGRLVSWEGNGRPTVNQLLDNIVPVLHGKSVVVICSDKGQKICNDKFKRIKKFVVGKRKVEVLQMKSM